MLDSEPKSNSEKKQKNWEGFIINDSKGQDKYKIGPQISSGGYGSVYYAENKMKKAYAVKISSLDSCKSSSILNNLEKEDESMQICESKFIMKCYESFFDKVNNLKIIVMELCNTRTILDLILEKGRFSEYEAKCVIKQVLTALAEIHRRGHIHRDIKSENICLLGLQCVLSDFGCAKKFLTDEEKKQDWRKTRSKYGTLVGTIVYKSPEILDGKDYGQKAELWAVGILFYQMVTGTLPFFLSSDTSNKHAYEYIKNNIEQIYDIDFIRRNYLDNFLTKLPEQFSISEEAINFMKQLIVIKEEDRAGWRTLSENKYLQEQEAKEIWTSKECIIPFENLDWSKVSKSFGEIGNESSETNPRINNQIEKSSIELSEKNKVSLKESKELKRNKEEYEKKENILYENIKKSHFEIRRLTMLMNFRGFLGNLDKYNVNCSLFCMLITRYCFLKYSEILTAKEIEEIMVMNNLKFSSFINGTILPDYEHDAMNYQRDREKNFMESLLKKIMATLSKKVALQENEILNHEMNSVYKNISEAAKEFKEKLGKIQACDGEKEEFQKIKYRALRSSYNIFLDNPVQILKASYEPDKEQWESWENFETIIKNQKQKEVKNQKKKLESSQVNSFCQQIPE